MTEQTKETKQDGFEAAYADALARETAKEEHDRRIKQGRISFLSAGATRKR